MTTAGRRREHRCILVHDYSGHPFQVQLSRELARRGNEVLHLHFGGFQTPKGALAQGLADPTSFRVEAVCLDRPFAKNQFVQRWFQERELGRILARRIRAFDPDVVISGNAPLDVQAAALEAARGTGAAFVFWMQDVYSEAIDRIMRRKVPGLGYLVALRFRALERRLLRQSDVIVVITDDFRPLLARWDVAPGRVVTIQNWAPLDDISPRPKSNRWAHKHDLATRQVILYAGTLGLKHNPALLLELAHQMHRECPEARLVVVSEGLGADWLREHAQGIDTLVQLPFQPFDQLPEVIATADVVLAILEPDAGVFSVPSKVLTYLAAGRPIVAAIPAENLAARLVAEQRAGMVVSPDDPTALAIASIELLSREGDRREMGQRARSYALRAFGISEIADRFEAIMGMANPVRMANHNSTNPPMAGRG